MLVTIPIPMRTRQQDILTLWQNLYNNTPMPVVEMLRNPKFVHTFTKVYQNTETKHLLEWQNQIRQLYAFCTNWKDERPGLEKEYTPFQIPKKTGGLRTIHAPSDELKKVQRTIAHTFQYLGNNLYPYVYVHDCAYAYVQGRDCLEAMRTHQMHGSRWFLKLDIKNFFPSCTRDFVVHQLMHLYPFGTMLSGIWNRALNYCFYEDSLPQGAITSPLLSNLVMVSIDKEISSALYNYNKHTYIYTRYADDIIISCKESFDPAEITAVVSQLLADTPFRLKQEKTRYGSIAGRNWNLGLMLNQNNKITLGHMKHKQLKAALHNFHRDYGTPNQWSIADTQTLVGELGYLKHIEPEVYQLLLQKEFRNTPLNLTIMVKSIMNP